MKTHVKIRNLLTAAGVAAMLATQCSEIFADDKRPEAKASVQAYDLVISNGMLTAPQGRTGPASLPAVVDVLRKQYADANIVIAPELSDTMMGDLKLHAHELPEMLEAIRVASGGKFDWSGPNSPNGAPTPGAIDPATGLPVASGTAPGPNSGLYILRPPAQTPGNERIVEAFNVEPFIKAKLRETEPPIVEKAAREDFAYKMMALVQEWSLDAVSACDRISYDEAQKRINFRQHQGANLIIAIGSRGDLNTIRGVVNALVGEPSHQLRADLEIPTSYAPAEPLSVETFPLKFAKIDSAYAVAMSLLSDKRSKVVLSDAREKTLIVMATKAEATAIRAAIAQLDQRVAVNVSEELDATKRQLDKAQKEANPPPQDGVRKPSSGPDGQ